MNGAENQRGCGTWGGAVLRWRARRASMSRTSGVARDPSVRAWRRVDPGAAPTVSNRATCPQRVKSSRPEDSLVTSPREIVRPANSRRTGKISADVAAQFFFRNRMIALTEAEQEPHFPWIQLHAAAPGQSVIDFPTVFMLDQTRDNTFEFFQGGGILRHRECLAHSFGCRTLAQRNFTQAQRQEKPAKATRPTLLRKLDSGPRRNATI